jgi:hypothetical protein
MSNVPPPPPPPGDLPPATGSSVPPVGSVPPPASAPLAGSVPPPAPSPSPYAAPAPGQQSPYAAPGGPGPKQTLSLTSFIVGLAGLLILSWIPILGLLVGIAAVVLGFMAKGREPGAPSWMWIVGVISGFVTILVNLLITVFVLILPLVVFGSLTTIPTSP